jgi:hypothetical protein
MSLRFVAVGAIGMACAFLLAAPLGATPTGKQPIQIDSRAVGIWGGSGNFFLFLGKGGDLGKVTFTRSFGPDRKAPDGLEYSVVKETDTLKGKNGTLVIRAVGSTYSLNIGPAGVWEGTWSIVSGTGDYSGLKGGGRWFGATLEPSHALNKRSTGFVQP